MQLDKNSYKQSSLWSSANVMNVKGPKSLKTLFMREVAHILVWFPLSASMTFSEWHAIKSLEKRHSYGYRAVTQAKVGQSRQKTKQRESRADDGVYWHRAGVQCCIWRQTVSLHFLLLLKPQETSTQPPHWDAKIQQDQGPTSPGDHVVPAAPALVL